jgi:hypothetical protein
MMNVKNYSIKKCLNTHNINFLKNVKINPEK